MFLFIRLLLAHFIGDFPLQIDPVYKLKFKGLHGVAPHAIIIGACGAVMSWPYLHLPIMWFFLIFMAATHLVQDSIKLNFSEAKYSFWSYLLDQLSHIGLISVVFLTNIRKFHAPVDQSNPLVRMYSNDGLMIYFIMLLAATYNGHYMIRCFKDTFMVKTTQCYVYEKWFGMCERAVIVSLFLTPIPVWLIIPISLALRPLTYLIMKRTLKLHPCFMAVPDMVLSWIFGLLFGFSFYLLQARYPVY